MHMMYGYGWFWPMTLMFVYHVGIIILGIYLIRSFINGGNKKPYYKRLKNAWLKVKLMWLSMIG